VGAVEKLLGDFRCDDADLWEASPLRPPEDWRQDAAHLISTLFREGEHINIVTDFTRRGDKCSPMGRGVTLPREEWLDRLSIGSVPEGEAGAWIRINPTDGAGISDNNVTRHAYLLVESDSLPIPLQLALLARLPIPIAALVSTAGRSVHAWLKIDCPDFDSFRNTAGAILARLEPFGVDHANRNPSRLARFPGVWRHNGSAWDRQRLLYLNPNCNACLPIFPK